MWREDQLKLPGISLRRLETTSRLLVNMVAFWPDTLDAVHINVWYNIVC